MTPLPDDAYDTIARVLIDEAERLATEVAKTQSTTSVEPGFYDKVEGAA